MDKDTPAIARLSGIQKVIQEVSALREARARRSSVSAMTQTSSMTDVVKGKDKVMICPCDKRDETFFRKEESL